MASLRVQKESFVQLIFCAILNTKFTLPLMTLSGLININRLYIRVRESYATYSITCVVYIHSSRSRYCVCTTWYYNSIVAYNDTIPFRSILKMVCVCVCVFHAMEQHTAYNNAASHRLYEIHTHTIFNILSWINLSDRL